MYFVAIDPGNSAAIAIISGKALSVFSWPEEKATIFLNLSLLSEEPHVIGIEKVHAIYRATATSTFNFGANYGYWKGVLDAFHLTPVDIPIKDWQKTVTNPPEKPKTKGMPRSQADKIKREHKKALKMESFRAASEAFPKVRFPSHDVTDAVNMACYIRHIYEEKQNGKEEKVGKKDKESI